MHAILSDFTSSVIIYITEFN